MADFIGEANFLEAKVRSASGEKAVIDVVGQELTVAVTKEGPNGLPVPVDVKYGKVESVNLTGGVPMLKLEGDDEEYPLSYVLGIGRIDNPYAEDEDEEGGNEGGEGDKVTEKGKTENPLLDENLYV